jgi:hypothetical protein
MIAEILAVSTTEATGAIRSTDPRDTHSRPRRELWIGGLGDFRDDLMAGNHPWQLRGQLAFDNMQVRAAYAAGENLQNCVAILGDRFCMIFDEKRALTDGGRLSQNGCSHHRYLTRASHGRNTNGKQDQDATMSIVRRDGEEYFSREAM